MRRNVLAASASAAVLVLGLSACNSKSSSSSAAASQAGIISAEESSALAQASHAVAKASAAASSVEAQASLPADSAPASSAPADSSAAESSPADGSSDDSSSGAAPSGFNPCSLLSVSKASSITGEKFAKSDADHIDRNDYTCTFETSDGDALLMDVAVPSDETTWNEASQAAAEGGASVPGVGKRAIAGGVGFAFDTGKYYISFQFADPDGGDKNAIALAKYILTEPAAS
jgi:hypothetical protein